MFFMYSAAFFYCILYIDMIFIILLLHTQNFMHIVIFPKTEKWGVTSDDLMMINLPPMNSIAHLFI